MTSWSPGPGESQRLTAFLHGYCATRGVGFVRYTMAEGIQSYPTLPGDQAARAHRADPQHTPAQILQRLMTDLRDGDRAAMLVFDYADGILDAERLGLDASILCEQVQALTADAGWHQKGLRLVLVDRGGGITTRLTGQPGLRTVHVGPPDQVELSIFAQQAARASVTGRLYLENGLSPAETGRRAGGLLNLHLHEIRLTSSSARPVTAEQISDLKAAAIRDTSGGTLELMPSRVSFAAEVAGLPAVRLALADAQRAGRTTLRILLSGPPGTGKTLAATAIAASLNVPAVRYGEILNEYVGVAERNMARANHVLRAMAPLVLFIDEADQVGLGARGSVVSSNEVHQNMRAALFEFLGDTGEQTGMHRGSDDQRADAPRRRRAVPFHHPARAVRLGGRGRPDHAHPRPPAWHRHRRRPGTGRGRLYQRWRGAQRTQRPAPARSPRTCRPCGRTRRS